MYITSILSYLGAWHKLQSKYPIIVQEIKQAIECIRVEDSSSIASYFHKPSRLSVLQINETLTEEFVKLLWSKDEKIWTRNGRRPIDLIKNRIGVEISFYSSRVIQSDLFTKYPLFARAQLIDLVVIIVPMESLYRRLSGRSAYFEELSMRLIDLLPIPLKYPFIIVGISETPSEIEIEELTTEMDSFLVDTIGLSLAEMKLAGEKERYDFKELPPVGHAPWRTTAHEKG